jgi:hypothetical protein
MLAQLDFDERCAVALSGLTVALQATDEAMLS